MFIAALFTIARIWKQPGCPSTDEWIRELWCVHTMEYHSAVQRNTFESVLVNLEPIIQMKSERERHILYVNTHICNLERQNQWSYMQGSEGDRCIKQTFGFCGRRRVWMI